MPFAFVCFSVVAALVVDDYGISWDQGAEDRLAEATAAYVLDGDDALFNLAVQRSGVFELGPRVVARLLGFEDIRDVYLSYRMTSHLFFLFAGVVCAILSYRVTGSRAAACVALLLFVLHPRLYAHSFFNSKDVPFLSLFMISLLSIHRAFSKDTLGAFALCGACVALAFNVRVMAFVLVLGVLAMRGLDLRFAASRKTRKRVLATTAVFLAVAAATTYGTWPRLWPEPVVGIAEAFREMLKVKTYDMFVLFEGDVRHMADVPRHYLPAWIGLTTPPFTLFLGTVGTAAALRRIARRPGEALRNTPARFECLCLMASWGAVAALAAAGANTYDGWRPLFFLFAPFSVLAAIGLAAMLAAIWRRRARLAAGGLAAAAAGSTALAMAEIHPYQNVYFNAFADRGTPEHLSRQYDMDYWATSYREALEYLLSEQPVGAIYVTSYHNRLLENNRAVLPPSKRARIVVASDDTVGFYVTNHREHYWTGHAAERVLAPVVYSRKVYDNTILSVAALNAALAGEAAANARRRAFEAATAPPPLAEWDFQAFLGDSTLSLVKEDCPPRDVRTRVALDMWPSDTAPDDESWRAPVRVEDRAFREANPEAFRWWRYFGTSGVVVDGACWVRLLSPRLPARLRVTMHTDSLVPRWTGSVEMEGR